MLRILCLCTELLLTFGNSFTHRCSLIESSTAKRKSLNPFARAAASSAAPGVVAATNSETRSKLIGLLQIAGIILVIALAVVVSRAPSTPAAGATVLSRPNFVSELTQVRVAQPLAQPFQISVAANGSISVRNYVNLSPQVSGRVERIAPGLRAGGEFSAGETLLVLDQEDFKLRLAQAQAEVASAQSNLLLQRAKSDAATANYALLNPGKIVPPLVALVPQIAQAKAQLAAAQSRADAARLDLSRTRFSLPFDGKVTNSSAEVGQLLNAGAAFGQVYAVDAVELVVPLPPDDLALIAPAVGRSVSVQDGQTTHQAKIERISAELDPRSRFAKVFVPIAANSGLQPGTFVDVAIAGSALPDALQLPESATQANGSVWYVKDNQLLRHDPVVLGRNQQGSIIQRFDYAQGIVLGAVPGAAAGQQVAVLGAGP
ncbi:MAG: efflux RND transporter periplasmic adaptor subunit [Gammaproteobacteria bacterium TMED92]|nr:MAG: efflux RND transporter periplasmic adaptor subunit [Gammaproteobacteria bacterium TMED92]